MEFCLYLATNHEIHISSIQSYKMSDYLHSIYYIEVPCMYDLSIFADSENITVLSKYSLKCNYKNMNLHDELSYMKVIGDILKTLFIS